MTYSKRDQAGAQLRERFSVPEILNTICHDVRASLSVTAGSASELASEEYGELSDMQRQLVGIVQRGNSRLGRLAGNLMFLSELWEGISELRPTRLDLRQLVSQTIDELRRQDPTSRVRCELELPKEPLFVLADPERLRQVLVNVFGIALAVAHAHVSVSLRERENGVELVVDDDGPTRRQTSVEGVKRVSSTELAIAVSVGLLELMGGSLSVETPRSAAGGCRTVMAVSTVAT